jgi:hypothetical protein
MFFSINGSPKLLILRGIQAGFCSYTFFIKNN